MRVAALRSERVAAVLTVAGRSHDDDADLARRLGVALSSLDRIDLATLAGLADQFRGETVLVLGADLVALGPVPYADDAMSVEVLAAGR